MQAVAEPVLDRVVGGAQGLGDDLPAKDPFHRLAAVAAAAEEIDLEPFDFEDIE